MAYPAHLETLQNRTWNAFRSRYPQVRPDFIGSSLAGLDNSGLDFMDDRLPSSLFWRLRIALSNLTLIKED